MVHLRATERLETHGQSPLQQRPKSAKALGNIQHSLNPALRPLLNNWARELSLLTPRQIAKQISNHCNQRQIRESVCQIIRKWAHDGVSPFPIAVGPIDSDLTLFNLTPTKGETQECEDSISHRLLLGSMSFILSCDHAISLNSLCDIFFQLIDAPIQDPATIIRLAWAAATLGTWLLVGLCHCRDDNCSCATQQTKETLHSLKESQAQMYCREQARSQDHATVLEQFQIGCTFFARPMARQHHPSLMVGELGIITAHCTTHGDLMATVEFPTHGSLEILMDINFIHPLETRENWSATGPQFTLGNKIFTLAKPVVRGVVHGFVTQRDGTSTVLIWSDTDKYVQLRPNQIQLGHTAPDISVPSTPLTPLSAGTCLSGCTLLANILEEYPCERCVLAPSLLMQKGNR